MLKNVFPCLKAVPYEEFLPLNDQVKVCFHDAGHILGSAMIEIVVQDENGSQNIIFSGDIGQWDKPLLTIPLSLIEQIMWSWSPPTEIATTIIHKVLMTNSARSVNDTVKANGNILIPTFAIERAQELLYHFSLLARAKKIPYIVIFLDSPMAVEVTKVFKQNKNLLTKKQQNSSRTINPRLTFRD